MSLIIDLIIIIAAILTIYHGILRGFIRSVMGFVSVILAVIAAYLFTGPAAAWLNEQFIGEWVSGIVDEALIGIVNAGTDQLGLDRIFTDRPEALTVIASQFGADLDAIAAHYFETLSGSAESEAVKELSRMIASPTAHAISTVLAAAAIFIAAMIVLRLLTWLLDLICRLPVLDKLNAFLGAVFGAGSACVLAWVIANLAAGLIIAFESIDPDMFNQSIISGSMILRFFHEKGWIFFHA